MYSETIASGDSTVSNSNGTITWINNDHDHNYNINGNWNDSSGGHTYTIHSSGGHTHGIYENNEQEINESTWNGTMGVNQEKYDTLKKITLDLIRGGFRCNIDKAKKLLKEEMEEKLFPKKEIEKPKEWIDPNLFEI